MALLRYHICCTGCDCICTCCRGQVYLRWVTDSDKYNEWMNPIDYETEEAIEEQEAAARAAGQVGLACILMV